MVTGCLKTRFAVLLYRNHSSLTCMMVVVSVGEGGLGYWKIGLYQSTSSACCFVIIVRMLLMGRSNFLGRVTRLMLFVLLGGLCDKT